MRFKRGQIDYPIITFFILVFGLLLLAPIILKIFNTTQSSLSSSLGNVTSGGIIAQTNFNAVMTTAINFWDKVIISAFVLSILLLFVSAFLIDTHPFWIILYIFISFFLVLFAPTIVGTLDSIYDSSTFATESTQLSFMNTLRSHFGVFLVGIIVITGIIIYGKIALFSGGGGSRR